MRSFSVAVMAATALVSAAALAEVPMLSGGVGKVERAQIEAEQSNYNTKLVFSGQAGVFVANVQVDVTDKAGNSVASILTDGPILLLQLPPGKYHVHAATRMHEKSFDVVAPGKGLKTVNTVFPIKDNPELTDGNGAYLPKEGDNGGYVPSDVPDDQ